MFGALFEKASRRFDPGEEATTRYRFEVVESSPIPQDSNDQ